MAKGKPIFAALSRPFAAPDIKIKTANVIAQTAALLVTHREQMDAVRETVDEARLALEEGRDGDVAGLLALLSQTLVGSVANHDAAIKEATAANALSAIGNRLRGTNHAH